MNTGFSKAVNIGIRKAETPYVILLNNDTKVEDCTAQRYADPAVLCIGKPQPPAPAQKTIGVKP